MKQSLRTQLVDFSRCRHDLGQIPFVLFGESQAITEILQELYFPHDLMRGMDYKLIGGHHLHQHEDPFWGVSLFEINLPEGTLCMERKKDHWLVQGTKFFLEAIESMENENLAGGQVTALWQIHEIITRAKELAG
jgi:hypothetical protein